MAYDLLFRGDDFVIVGMSYGCVDNAVFDVPGHCTLDGDSHLRYEPGHVAPQELWVDWALRKAAARRATH